MTNDELQVLRTVRVLVVRCFLYRTDEYIV